MNCHSQSHIPACISLLLILTLGACTIPGPLLSPVPASPTPIPSAIPTVTATSIPLAVSVNGAGISIPEFNAELARYQQAQTALGNTVSLDAATQAVRDEFVDNLLLAQAAAANGYQVEDTALQARIDSLDTQIGGPGKLTDWESAHGYTDADFRAALRLQMAAALMRDKIAASVPATAEQVHVNQILRYNADEAQKALSYLKAGWKFPDLAAQYDPVTKGELGWFPRGFLSDPAIENSAFALQPGQYSAVIQTQSGYDILYVVERDPAHLLSPDALLTLQEHAVQTWLTQQRNESKILFTP
jgi:peptidyl-prolyl cis-trans isomerase C